MGSWVKKSSAAIFLLACGSSTPQRVPMAGMSNADGVTDAPMFVFDSLDARAVSSEALRGKPTVLTFMTTYDPISQLQVNQLLEVASQTSDVQFVLVALQDASARELVEIYRDTMNVKFPVAMGDAATVAGGGVLGDVHQVPTTIILARDGRVAWRHAGAVRSDELRARLKKL